MDLEQLKKINQDVENQTLISPKFLKKEIIPSVIPLEKGKWIVVDNVASVFVDLTDSTNLAVGNKYDATSILGYYARALIEIFEHYNSAYLDYQGDGGFSLFDGVDSVKKAIDCATTLNTLFNIYKKLDVRIGIDIGSIYVKKVGKRRINKELWLGRPVSYSSKLCNLKMEGLYSIRISKKVYDLLNYSDRELCRTYQNFYHSGMYWSFAK